MNIVIPLAGPDFERADGSVKADQKVGSMTMFEATLCARPWAHGGRPVFVMLDRPACRRFAERVLTPRFPESAIAWLSAPTQGAAFSAAAGVALIDAPEKPVIVDLCDIIFESPVDAAKMFAADPQCGAIAPVFSSNSPAYSYLRQDAAGEVVEAREKVVISSNASAGVYMFRNAETFWAALSFGLRNLEKSCHQRMLYVCPLLNGVIDRGQRVIAAPAYNVVDVKVDHAGG